MVCEGAGSRRTSRSTMRPPCTGTTWISAFATSVVAMSARRRSSTSERLNWSPALKRAMIADVARAEGGAAADVDRAEARDRPGLHRQRQRREMGLVIDLDFLFAELRLGKSLPRRALVVSASPPAITSAAMTGSPDCTANMSRSLAASGTGRLEPRQLDRGEAILLPGIGGKDDPQGVAGLFGLRLDGGIIIALRAQQFGEQVGVGARAAADLGGVGGMLALRLERRLLAETPRAAPRHRPIRQGLRTATV